MQVMHPRCAALDLGKDIVVAAVRLQAGSEVTRECRTYGMTGTKLRELSSWLSNQGVTQVVMEATGSYWKSVWPALEGQFELTLANPASIRNLPGRKSDVNDATWMADLLAHGLIRGSFVPPAEIGGLRELTRTRKQFVREVVDRLRETPGLSDVGVPALLAEIGVDMTRFKTHRHLLSWARVCPRLDESAGKVHSRRTLQGAVWIKTLLIQAAWAAIRTKDSYLRAQFLRIRARRGAKKAIVAVAASILTAVYYMIRDGKPYQDLGIRYFDHHDRSRTARRFVARLQQLGYDVQITKVVA